MAKGKTKANVVPLGLDDSLSDAINWMGKKDIDSSANQLDNSDNVKSLLSKNPVEVDSKEEIPDNQNLLNQTTSDNNQSNSEVVDEKTQKVGDEDHNVIQTPENQSEESNFLLSEEDKKTAEVQSVDSKDNDIIDSNQVTDSQTTKSKKKEKKKDKKVVEQKKDDDLNNNHLNPLFELLLGRNKDVDVQGSKVSISNEHLQTLQFIHQYFKNIRKEKVPIVRIVENILNEHFSKNKELYLEMQNEYKEEMSKKALITF